MVINDKLTGWWFGIWWLIVMVVIVVKDGINQQQWEYDGYILVGGLEHFLCSPIVGIVIQSDFHIFQRGWNHQLVYIMYGEFSPPCNLWEGSHGFSEH